MSADAFNNALHVTLGFEGGVSDNKADRGGLTNFGITQATYSSWLTKRGYPDKPVTTITAQEVSALYRGEYWTPAGCDRMPDKLAVAHFDAAVNHGVRRACQLLQRAIGVNPDGVFGPRSVAALEAMLAKVGEADVITDYLNCRADFYDEIVEHDASQVVFLKGWKNRIAKLQSYVAA